jgi:hypothetical protein
LKETGSGALETNLNGNETGSRIEIQFENSMAEAANSLYGRKFYFYSCRYIDRAAPVLAKVTFSGNVCEPSEASALRIFFSEEIDNPRVVMDDLKVSLGTWDMVLDSIFILRLDTANITSSVFNDTSNRVTDVEVMSTSEIKLSLNAHYPYFPNEFLAYSFQIRGSGQISDAVRPNLVVVNPVETDKNRSVSVGTDESPKACALTSMSNTLVNDAADAEPLKQFMYLTSVWKPNNFPDSSCKETVDLHRYRIETEAQIFDLLGNLVNRIEDAIVVRYDSENAENQSTTDGVVGQAISVKFKWNWRNEKGRLVSAGGYLVLVTSTIKDMCGNMLDGGRTEFPPYKMIVPTHRSFER